LDTHTHTHIHNEEKEEKKTELLCRHLLSVGPEQQSNTPEASKQANKQTNKSNGNFAGGVLPYHIIKRILIILLIGVMIR
jgi:hypothetical protein